MTDLEQIADEIWRVVEWEESRIGAVSVGLLNQCIQKLRTLTQQPRECPDARPRVPDEMVLTDYRGGYGINTKHGFQRGTKFVEATRDEANGWNACRAAMLGDPE